MRNVAGTLRTVILGTALVVPLGGTADAQTADAPSTATATELERTITCRKSAWFFTEARVLASWARSAEGNFDDADAAALKRVEARGLVSSYEFRTTDGRVLRGRRLARAAAPSDGAVLFASGNVGTAEAMAAHYADLLEVLPYDLYFVDYRGYKLSRPGIPSFGAFVDDLLSISLDLRNRAAYKRLYAYGPSFGGVILMNAMAAGAPFDHLVIDSVPSTLEDYDCPTAVYPVEVLPALCPRVSAITAKNDREVRPREQAILLQKLSSATCGGSVLELPTAGHATNDKIASPQHKERMEAVGKLLGSR